MYNPHLIPLYRLENPALPFNQPEGDYFDRQIAGQWFDLYLDGALANITRATSSSENRGAPAQLAIAHVMTDKLDAYHASSHPIASRMRHFGDDYIIPRDGSVPIVELDIDEAIRARDHDRIYKMAARAVKSCIGRDLITISGRVF